MFEFFPVTFHMDFLKCLSDIWEYATIDNKVRNQIKHTHASENASLPIRFLIFYRKDYISFIIPYFLYEKNSPGHSS